MFVGDEVLLDVSFTVARARLANLTRGGWLLGASEDCYGLGVADLPGAAAPALSRLVRVRARELTQRDNSAGLAVRWEVTGPDGELSPVLDADITLLPAGSHATWLTLAGAYRPLDASGAAIARADVHRIAAATIRSFLSRLAAGVTGQPVGADQGSPAVPRAQDVPPGAQDAREWADPPCSPGAVG
jgi:hypothetical protein